MDGVTYVDSNHDPIIHEGLGIVNMVVINAGPCTIELLGWESPRQEGDARIRMTLWPGNTRSISAALIRARLGDGPNIGSGGHSYSAVGWRIVR
jgi:hypothetical protein